MILDDCLFLISIIHGIQHLTRSIFPLAVVHTLSSNEIAHLFSQPISLYLLRNQSDRCGVECKHALIYGRPYIE